MLLKNKLLDLKLNKPLSPNLITLTQKINFHALQVTLCHEGLVSEEDSKISGFQGSRAYFKKRSNNDYDDERCCQRLMGS
jgi:hypothetical protein